ncbi:hypothetical protein SOVF_010790, partial [Spinacia oleracea]
YVRSSPSRIQKFKACAEEENITSKALVCLDVDTRWNSTYLMLRSALVFKKAFKNMKTKCTPYVRELLKKPLGLGAPDDLDFDIVEGFLPFLAIFYEATLKLSGSRYVTGNMFVEDIYEIGFTISDYLSDPNERIRRMAEKMKLKFDKYWSNVGNINVLMFIALILDPRNKLVYCEYVVRRSYDVGSSITLCRRIRDTLNALFDCYANKVVSSSSVSTTTIHDEGVISGSNSAKSSRLRIAHYLSICYCLLLPAVCATGLLPTAVLLLDAGQSTVFVMLLGLLAVNL